MRVQAWKTHKVTGEDADILPILDRYLPPLKERCVVAVSSKVAAICEGRVEKISGREEKDRMIEREAEYYLPRSASKYDIVLTIKESAVVVSAGVDESNGNGMLVLWPKDMQATVNRIRGHLAARHGLQEIGVILTDSRTSPMRWGVTAVALAHSGFLALKDYRGKPDVFGRLMRMERVNVADSLATAAALVMGEGDEQTPLAVIEDIPFVEFQERNPLPEEQESLRIAKEDDLYGALLTAVPWKTGGHGNAA